MTTQQKAIEQALGAMGAGKPAPLAGMVPEGLQANRLRNDPNSITIEHGPALFYLGHWRTARDGKFGPLWLAAIGARADVATLLERLDRIRSDARLSDGAKADDEKDAARATLRELGNRQRAVNVEAELINADRMKLADVAPADAAQAVVDVALAAHFRTMGNGDRDATMAQLVSGAEARMVDAVLRLPACLFGLTPEMRAVIESNAIARRSPEAVLELDQRGLALRTTQQVLARCVELVVERSALTLEERMVNLGAAAWQPHVRDGDPGALAALARRYGVPEAG